MGGSIEGRMPFMDTELATLTARFPDSHFTRHPKGKAVLRTVAEDLIDGLTIKRPKVGFRVPVGDWFRGDQKANLLDLLKSGESLTRRMLDPVAIDTLVDQHLSHQSDNEKMLWTLTNLEMFLRTLRPDLP